LKLIVNGESLEYSGDPSLARLLREQKAESDRVAVMLNDRMVPRSERDRQALSDGDRVEILVFAGGGGGYGCTVNVGRPCF
jgi:sulfur carrier protein